MRTQAKAVRVDSDIYEVLRDYAEKTGVPVANIAREALRTWVKDVAPSRLRAFGKTR